MAKKKVSTEDNNEVLGGIASVMAMVKAVDDSAEIIEDSVYSNIHEWVPSGNYVLNACMSGDLFKAVPSGRVVALSGNSGCLPKNEKVEIYILKGKIQNHDIKHLRIES